MTKRLLSLAAFCLQLLACHAVLAQAEYLLGPGDAIRIQVFQNPDLTLETRLSESGSITYPLIGTVQLGGRTLAEAEQRIAGQLHDGGFVHQPQVTVVVLQIFGNQVAVLGQVNRPGRYPIETINTRLTDMLATAGGIASGGADTVVLVGSREGRDFRREIDIPALFFADGGSGDNLRVIGGDTLYVHRAPVFYIYGEVQRPGAYRVERGMTVMQALAQGGGPTLRGTERRLRLHRQDNVGTIVRSTPALLDAVRANDVIYVHESLF